MKAVIAEAGDISIVTCEVCSARASSLTGTRTLRCDARSTRIGPGSTTTRNRVLPLGTRSAARFWRELRGDGSIDPLLLRSEHGCLKLGIPFLLERGPKSTGSACSDHAILFLESDALD